MDGRADALAGVRARAFVAGAMLSGIPSAAHAVVARRSLRGLIDYGLEATRAAGTLIPPGQPSIGRGIVAHALVSAFWTEVLIRALPRRHAVTWGAVAGLGIGLVGVVVIGRRLPAIRRLPPGPQLADNVAFGAIVGAVVAANPKPRQ